MDGPGADDLAGAVEAMTAVLVPAADRDWRRPAGELEWDCWTTAAHVAHDLLAYAGQLSALPAQGYLPVDLVVRPTATVAEVLQVVRSCAGLLQLAVAAAAPGDRAWHFGLADRTGFAALGLNEVLVHTWDVTQGLGLTWSPPSHLAALVVRRLFPDAPGGEPGDVLLWCTARVALPDRPRRTQWLLPRAAAD